MKRKILSVILAIMLVFLVSSFEAFANQTCRVYLDDQELQFDVAPQILNGRVMVPMRAIFEALDATVSWDSSTKTAHAYNYDIMKGVSVTIGRPHMLDAYMNVIPLDVPAIIRDGRTLVPLRAISVAFNCDVEWDKDTRSVRIFTEDFVNNSHSSSDSGYKTLRVATNAEFPPYEFWDGNELRGIDIDIANKIAEELGVKLEFIDMAFDALIPSVKSGKCDFVIAGIVATEERLQEVKFTNSYVENRQVIIVNKNSTITNVVDLFADSSNTKIGVQLDTTGDLYCTWDIEDEGLGTVERYNKGADAVMALKLGKVDCVVMDDMSAEAFVKENPGLKILDTEYITENYGIAVKKENTELLNKINAAINKLIANGTIDSIVRKYTLLK